MVDYIGPAFETTRISEDSMHRADRERERIGYPFPLQQYKQAQRIDTPVQLLTDETATHFDRDDFSRQSIVLTSQSNSTLLLLSILHRYRSVT